MLSILYEEKILNKVKEEEYLSLIKSHGVNHFEFGLDPCLFKSYHCHIKHWENFDVSFHMPYFTNPLYATERIGESQSKALLVDYLTFVDVIRQSEHPTIVIHLAPDDEGETPVRCLDFLLNQTARMHLPFNFALETHKSGDKGFVSREMLQNMIKPFNSERLMICADLTHEYMATGEVPMLDQSVGHVHFHGFDHKASHLSLTDANKKVFEGVLPDYLHQHPLVLETLFHEAYLSRLIEDIKWVNERLLE